MKKIILFMATVCSFLIFQQSNGHAATGFSKPNLSGTWYVYITVTETAQDSNIPPNYYVARAGYVRGVIKISKNGRVIPAEDSLYYYDFKSGESIIDVTGGVLKIYKNGIVKGVIDITDSSDAADTITIEHSKMDKGKTVITGIVKDTADSASYGMFSAVKR